jgi:uncharacterized protein (DUF58 family)
VSTRDAAAPSPPLAPYAELLDAVTGLSWPAAVRVRTGDPGAHRSTRLGRSPEFTEYRAYRAGDDLRRLDWKLFARTDRLFLRIADDHAALRTAIVMDTSASMHFPAGRYSKWDHASRIAIALSAIAIADGDAIALDVPTAAGVRRVGPSRRRDVLNDAATVLAQVDIAAENGATSIVSTLAQRPGDPRLVVVSDFLGDTDAVLRALRVAAAAGSEVVAVHVVAAEELEPARDAFVAVDPERRELRRPMSDANRVQYAEAFARWRQALADELRAMRATYVMTTTTDAVADVVRRIVSVDAR